MLLVTGPSGNVGAELTAHLARSSTAPSRVTSGTPRATHRYISRPAGSDRSPGLSQPVHLGADPAGRGPNLCATSIAEQHRARKAIIPFITTAAAAGCRHVVYISVLRADRARFIPHFKVKAAPRQHIPDFTMLLCGFFTQNLHPKISTHGTDITEHHELFIPAGNGATAFLDARDAAEVAAAILVDSDRHRGAVYHLTGPQRLTMAQVAGVLSAALGYPVRYNKPSLLAFAWRLRGRGVGYDTIMFMAAVYTLTRMGFNQQISTDVFDLLRRPACTVEDYLAVSAWRWHQPAWT